MNQNVLVVVGEGDAVLRTVALVANTRAVANGYELKKGGRCPPFISYPGSMALEPTPTDCELGFQG